MKRFAFLLFLAGCLLPLTSAQDEEHVGVFSGYFRLAQTDNNFGGVDALASFQEGNKIRGPDELRLQPDFHLGIHPIQQGFHHV
jgi:hypothetical protein